MEVDDDYNGVIIDDVEEDNRPRRTSVVRDKDDTKYQVPPFSVIKNEMPNYGKAHQLLLQHMIQHPVSTRKHFYITYIRCYVTQVLKKDPYVVPRIQAEPSELNKFTTKLVTTMNAKAKTIGLRLTAIERESDGKELIILISERHHSEALVTVIGYSADEIYLLTHYITEMMTSGDGKMGYGDALNQASELPNPIPLRRAAAVLKKLAEEKWFRIDKEDNVWLEPRAVAELGPLLRTKYLPPICKLCENVVIRVSLAITCDKCQASTHSHCFKRLLEARVTDEDSIKCLNGTCTEKMSKRDILEKIDNRRSMRRQSRNDEAGNKTTQEENFVKIEDEEPMEHGEVVRPNGDAPKDGLNRLDDTDEARTPVVRKKSKKAPKRKSQSKRRTIHSDSEDDYVDEDNE